MILTIFSDAIANFTNLVGADNIAITKATATSAMSWLGSVDNILPLAGLCLALLAIRLSVQVLPVVAIGGLLAMFVADPLLVQRLLSSDIFSMLFTAGMVILLALGPRFIARGIQRTVQNALDPRERAISARIAELEAEAKAQDIEAAAHERFAELQRQRDITKHSAEATTMTPGVA